MPTAESSGQELVGGKKRIRILRLTAQSTPNVQRRQNKSLGHMIKVLHSECRDSGVKVRRLEDQKIRTTPKQPLLMTLFDLEESFECANASGKQSQGVISEQRNVLANVTEEISAAIMPQPTRRMAHASSCGLSILACRIHKRTQTRVSSASA